MTNSWRDFFDAHAERYDDNSFTAGTSAEVDAVIHELDVSPGAALLDIGCGTGRHSVELARRGYRVTGVDLSEGMLRHARAKAAEAGVDVTWLEADATSAELPTTFDGALCLCEGAFGLLSTGHDALEQPLAILRSIRRALKPGSRAIFTVLNGAPMIRRAGSSDAGGSFDLDTLVETSPFAADGDHPARLMRERGFLPSELRLMFRLTDFDVLHVGGGTAGRWGRRPVDLDEIEVMVIAEATTPRST